MKDREVVDQNEKMFGRLLSILKKENQAVAKARNMPGPVSLNIGSRRQSISHINTQNEQFSKRLNFTKSVVPSVVDMHKFTEKHEEYRKCASRSPRQDPLITMKKNFEASLKIVKRHSVATTIAEQNRTFVSNQTIGHFPSARGSETPNSSRV